MQMACAARPLGPLPRNTPAAYKHARLKPTDLSETSITGGYLHPYIERSMATGVLDYLEKFEAHGFIENFRIVGKKLEKKHSGWANCNEFVYKLVEAAGYYATRSDKIAGAFAKTNADILSSPHVLQQSTDKEEESEQQIPGGQPIRVLQLRPLHTGRNCMVPNDRRPDDAGRGGSLC
jgi:hypothetical protein